jgi:tetraacyldisaccharide 4'-kinase
MPQTVLEPALFLQPMFTPSTFHDLVSGRRRGALAATIRLGLRAAEGPYTWAVAWRNCRYDRRTATIHRVDVPVVSVGNLTLGGTGKTPMVEWLARWFGEQGVRVGIVSRGYGATPGGRNDEAIELEQKLPGVPHVQNPDRVAAARQAIEQRNCQLLVLDDAFQHRRMARDLDIVMLDALNPFGFGHVFPRGLLREPVAGLRRADVVVLSRADLIDPPGREAIRREVQRHAPQALWAEVAHAAKSLLAADGREESLGWLENKAVAAFCGVGNPAGFRHTLERCRCRVVAFREFPDHHRFGEADVAALGNWIETLSVTGVLCTHKDLVKLGFTSFGGVALWAVRVGIKFLSGQSALQMRLRTALNSSPVTS